MNLRTATIHGIPAPKELTRGKLIAGGVAHAGGIDLAARAEKVAAVAAEHAALR